MENSDEYILLFDGVCNLCNGLVQFIIKRDKGKRFRFAALQSDAGRALLKKANISPDRLESLVLIKGNQFFLKSTAALKVLHELGSVWRLFYGFIWVPRSVRDFVYDLIAKSRYSVFGKRDVCMVPTPELESRFL